MLRIKVFDIKEFIKTVNECTGAVILLQNGEKLDLNKNYDAQRGLQQRYSENGKCLLLELNIPDAKDYFKMVIAFISKPL